MAFHDPAAPSGSDRRLSIAPFAGGWAIKHGDGFLGVSADLEEAVRLLQVLQEPAPDRADGAPGTLA
jgi:hypothetical protein